MDITRQYMNFQKSVENRRSLEQLFSNASSTEESKYEKLCRRVVDELHQMIIDIMNKRIPHNMKVYHGYLYHEDMTSLIRSSDGFNNMKDGTDFFETLFPSIRHSQKTQRLFNLSRSAGIEIIFYKSNICLYYTGTY